MARKKSSFDKEMFLKIAGNLDRNNTLQHNLNQSGVKYPTFLSWLRKGKEVNASFLFKKFNDLYDLYKFSDEAGMLEIIKEVEEYSAENESFEDDSFEYVNVSPQRTAFLVEWQKDNSSARRFFSKKRNAEIFKEGIDAVYSTGKAQLTEIVIED